LASAAPATISTRRFRPDGFRPSGENTVSIDAARKRQAFTQSLERIDALLVPGDAAKGFGSFAAYP
jgi:hypothetical protein